MFSRCLIYKVHCPLSRWVFIVSHLSSFVKNFFQVLSKFFTMQSLNSQRFARFLPAFFRSPSTVRNSYILPHLQALVKNFFLHFEDFFLSVARFCGALCGFPQALVYNTKGVIICQALFSSFFEFFHNLCWEVKQSGHRCVRSASTILYKVLTACLR